MNIIEIILQNLASFIVIISIIVFIHEFGHFFVARLCGVKVEEFAIGFGKKIFGFKDKKGTEWKFCLLPFGGYVKMYGDRNGASMPDLELISKMSASERKISFIGKNVYQRMAIVSAGPIANFILTIFLLTIIFKINGINHVQPVVSEVVKDSPAYKAGLQKRDLILAVDGKEVDDFVQVKDIIVSGLEKDLMFKIMRNNQVIEIKVSPEISERLDVFNEKVKVRVVGFASNEIKNEKLNIFRSFIEANKETYNISVSIFKVLGQLITGDRSIKEMGGPVKIAKYSGKSVDQGLQMVIWFMALISVNLGVMNLLPIPVLDGGHLFFYVIEAIRKKPLSKKIQQYAYNFGFSFILTLMIFTTFNDLFSLYPH